MGKAEKMSIKSKIEMWWTDEDLETIKRWIETEQMERDLRNGNAFARWLEGRPEQPVA